MRPRRIPLALCAVLQFAATPALADRSPWSFGGELGFGYDSNTGNAEAVADIRDSGFATGAFHATLGLPVARLLLVQLRGSLSGDAYDDVEALSNAKAAGTVRVILRTGPGFYVPTVGLWGSLAYWEFDSAIRDSTEARYGLFLSQRLTTKLNARLGVSGMDRDSDSRVFDLAGASATLDLDWAFRPGTVIYSGYQFYDGDIVSTASPTLKVVNWAEVIEADDAFGGFATGQFAYRLDGRTHALTFGFNQALSRRFALDARMQSVDADAKGGIEYDRWIGTFSVLARF